MVKSSARYLFDTALGAGPTCTAAHSDGAFCDTPVPEGAPVSMCGHHLLAAFRWCQDLVGQVERGDKFERFHRYDRRNRLAKDRSFVYYFRFGNEVKIGTTYDLRSRHRELCPDDVLAVEWGARELEVRRHRQFDHLKLPGRRKEYFELCPEILEFIYKLPEFDFEPILRPKVRQDDRFWQDFTASKAA